MTPIQIDAATEVKKCVIHDEGKGGIMNTEIDRVIRNLAQYPNDEMNPILMSLRLS